MPMVTLRQRQQLSPFLETLCPLCLLQSTQGCVWKSLGKVICECSASHLHDTISPLGNVVPFVLGLMCSSEGYTQHCKAGFFKLEGRDGPCGVFVTVKCGNGKHCSGGRGGTASSVRSGVVLKVSCFEAVPERQFGIPFCRM